MTQTRQRHIRSDAKALYHATEYAHEYRCPVCRHRWFEWSMKQEPHPVDCPNCGAPWGGPGENPDAWARYYRAQFDRAERAERLARELDACLVMLQQQHNKAKAELAKLRNP